ncbi:TolAlike protein [Acanthamoeba castellanii str. Neff]|uniref:TolAlike protein n=1 Tax=Acanthamoeba castellanii (strain ATCC 30010 / Neff) TaxID=1257118 RepID=L8H1F0_ACACF|nr:TolAlike protein [Acanthamoeba castellanii str. Neff]ELR19334.1 TolAlike protein [Acanthamoeba castellanii str. Neff]
MSLQGSNDKEKLESLCKKTYKEQAVWFLNAFWGTTKDDAEKFWKFVAKCIELDTDKKAAGSDLDEFQAHRFLEHFQESMTVQAMRDRLRNTGAISAGQFKRVPLTHMLTFKYNVDWHELVNAVQGDQEEIRKAQKMLDEVNAAFSEAESKKEEATAALHSAKQREEELKAAKVELEAALAELKAQEDAYNHKTEDLKKRSEEGGVVQRNKAKNELAQHLAEDPLPLRKAKITQEAAVKKTERAAVAAEAAAQEAARAKEAAEAAFAEASKRVEEAEAYLEKAKNSLPHGGVWWMERELHEAKAYLPKSKGGFNPREK